MNIGVGVGIKYVQVTLKIIVHKVKSIFDSGIWDFKGRWNNNDIFKF